MVQTVLKISDVNSSQQGCNKSKFVRPHIHKLKPYTPILPFEVLSQKYGKKPQDIIKLDANENPYGPPPQVLQKLGSLEFAYIYPDPETRKLRRLIAQQEDIDIKHLLVGCGADELIDLIMRLCLDPGDFIIDLPPTFTMYSFDAAVNDAQVISIDRTQDFSINIQKVKDTVANNSRVKIVFITSPNNPDGSMITDEQLLSFLQMDVLVVLDEAYIEFSKQQNHMKWVEKHDNLVVLRTFSKSAGLAGIRVGYGAFPTNIVDCLWKIKQPYNVSVAAEEAACVALENIGYMQEIRDIIVDERDRLSQFLSKVDYLKIFPSNSNFILCEVTQGYSALQLKEDLAQQYGIMVRHYQNKYLQNYIRISVGKKEHTDSLIKVLSQYKQIQ